MSLDISLLQIMKHQADYVKLIAQVPTKALDPKTATLLRDFRKFHREFGKDVDATFWNVAFPKYHPKLDDDQLAIYQALAPQIAGEPDQQVAEGIRSRLIATDVAEKLTDLIFRFNEGEDADLYGELRSTIEHFEKETNRKVKTPWVKPDTKAMFDEDKNDIGFKWRLRCLNECMRPLRAGDFIIVAARPDKGKTTFFTSELTFMAAQIDELFPGTNRPILWFNNEGKGDRIYKRLYNSALNRTVDELWRLSDNGTLESDFIKAIGGRDEYDRIRIMDVHDFWHTDIEDIIAQMNPCLVVFDMLDNIRFGGDVLNGGTRTDQMLEAMYQWGRVLGVKYDCAVMATSQISGDADGEPYPALAMLKDSRTGKQGTADAIITLGASNDPALEAVRFIGTTKNKLARPGAKKNPRAKTIFDGARARYCEAEGID